jgi:hypothetical protein
LCEGAREEGGGETAGPWPSGAFPPSAVTTPLAHSYSLRVAALKQVCAYLSPPLRTAHRSDQLVIGEGLGSGPPSRHTFGHKGLAYRTTRPIRQREPAKAPLQRKSKRGLLSITYHGT